MPCVLMGCREGFPAGFLWADSMLLGSGWWRLPVCPARLKIADLRGFLAVGVVCVCTGSALNEKDPLVGLFTRGLLIT